MVAATADVAITVHGYVTDMSSFWALWGVPVDYIDSFCGLTVSMSCTREYTKLITHNSFTRGVILCYTHRVPLQICRVAATVTQVGECRLYSGDGGKKRQAVVVNVLQGAMPDRGIATTTRASREFFYSIVQEWVPRCYQTVHCLYLPAPANQRRKSPHYAYARSMLPGRYIANAPHAPDYRSSIILHCGEIPV